MNSNPTIQIKLSFLISIHPQQLPIASYIPNANVTFFSKPLYYNFAPVLLVFKSAFKVVLASSAIPYHSITLSLNLCVLESCFIPSSSMVMKSQLSPDWHIPSQFPSWQESQVTPFSVGEHFLFKLLPSIITSYPTEANLICSVRIHSVLFFAIVSVY